MPNPTNNEGANAPLWNASTTQQVVTLTGGFDALTTTGYFVIISNTGANNISVGPSNTVAGVLVQPGATFETAIIAGSPIFITGTAAQTATVIEYKA